MTEKFCKRPGCDKKLRSTNTTGVCATGCRSTEASPSERVVGTRSVGAKDDVLRRFRLVARALGKDPEAILVEAAQTWLDTVAKAVE